jgi:hypothetical protein
MGGDVGQGLAEEQVGRGERAGPGVEQVHPPDRLPAQAEGEGVHRAVPLLVGGGAFAQRGGESGPPCRGGVEVGDGHGPAGSDAFDAGTSSAWICMSSVQSDSRPRAGPRRVPGRSVRPGGGRRRCGPCRSRHWSGDRAQPPRGTGPRRSTGASDRGGRAEPRRGALHGLAQVPSGPSSRRGQHEQGRAVPRGVPPARRAIARDPTCTACRVTASASGSGGGGRRPTTGCLRGVLCVRAHSFAHGARFGGNGASPPHRTWPSRSPCRRSSIRHAGRSSTRTWCTDSGVTCTIKRIEPAPPAVSC